jgi:DNA-binding NtrC family response regulator
MSNVRILVIDDQEDIVDYCRQYIDISDAVVHARNGVDGFTRLSSFRPDLILLDKRFIGLEEHLYIGPETDYRNEGIHILKKLREKNPDIPVIMVTADGDFDAASTSLKAGAFDFIEWGALYKDEFFLKNKIEAAVAHREKDIELLVRKYNALGLIGRSERMIQVFRDIENVSQTSDTLLILGETGTGKEIVARAVHESGPRRLSSYIVIDCTSVPSDLIESELFGIEKGTATGVEYRVGRFELADGGTVFLDEIGELPLEQQTKLLRVLETGEIWRVGGRRSTPIDVRIIAASNRNLAAMIKHGDFRKDLYYRLNKYPVSLPPLEERKSDIPELARYFLRQVGSRFDLELFDISEEAMKYLIQKSWNGNVRELKNTIEQASIYAQKVLTLKDLVEVELRKDSMYSADRPILCEGLIPPPECPLLKDRTFVEIEKEAIRWVLNRTKHNIEQTARVLGVGRSTIYEKAKKYKL